MTDGIAINSFQGKTAAYFTLGCKLNFAETSTFERQLKEIGIRTAEKGEQADLVVVNTCAVTDVAERKCRQAIGRLVRQHPGAFTVVTGCYAQLRPEQTARLTGVSLVLGSEEKARFVELVTKAWLERLKTKEAKDLRPETEDQRHETEEAGTGAAMRAVTQKTKDIRAFAPSCSRGNRTRFFLKVQDGCDYFCTYCTIPYARGFSRNPTIASLVAQARQAAAEGGKEIVLTGVNIGDFGKSTGETFLDLIKALDTEVEGISRFRISSLEPDLLTEDIISYCARSRAFMPHFHIPLQSGSDTVLRLMRRHYDARLFEERVLAVKEAMPEAFIGVDVMAGCRGETPECFEETYALLQRLPVSQLHVFPYSERPGTSALNIPYTVSRADRDERCDRLLELSEQKTFDFYGQHQGTTAEVLFEKAVRGRAMHGFTPNYVRVELAGRDASPEYDNEIVSVTLGDFNHDGTALMAQL